MVIIRLRRGGRRHEPHYRIVAQEKRSKLNGAFIESIGHYHPATKDKELVIDADRAKYWLAQGAQLSVTVNNLFVKEEILPKKNKISRVYNKKKKKDEEGEEKKEEVKTEEKAEVKEEKEKEEKTETK